MLAPSVLSPLLALESMDADRERIEAAMHEAVRTPDHYLNEIASHLIVAGARHELMMEQDRYRAQFWAAFDAFVPGTPLFK